MMEDLPEPLGPVTNRLWPASTFRLNCLASILPLGVLTSTCIWPHSYLKTYICNRVQAMPTVVYVCRVFESFTKFHQEFSHITKACVMVLLRT